MNIVYIPFTKSYFIDLGIFYYFWCSSHCWLCKLSKPYRWIDGLAIGPAAISALSFAFITYFTGNLIYSEYLKIPYISDTGELVIICAALIGAGLGFYGLMSSQWFLWEILVHCHGTIEQCRGNQTRAYSSNNCEFLY